MKSRSLKPIIAAVLFSAVTGIALETAIAKQRPADNQAAPKLQPAKQSAPGAGNEAKSLKQNWISQLLASQKELEGVNDAGTSAFVGDIMESLIRQHGEPSASDQVSYGERIADKTRELMRARSLKSAAILYLRSWYLFNQPGPGADGPPANVNTKTGAPGPGGLVLYLPFDERDSGGIVHDQSGAGNHGKVFGATWVPEGHKGGAYRFDITHLTDRIVIANSPLLSPAQITLAAWVNVPEDGGGFWGRIFDKDYRKGYALNITGELGEQIKRGQLALEINRRAGFKSSRTLADGKWHHVAATSDGQTVRMYVDGVEESRKEDRKLGPVKNNNWDLCIGNTATEYRDTDGPCGNLEAFDGLIDEARIYNRALSADEIRALAGAPETGGGASVAASGAASPAIETTPLRPSRVPAKAEYFRGRWFHIYEDDDISWQQARKKCERLGGRLAIVPDQATWDFLAPWAGRARVWLGATDEEQEGRWKWVDGSPMTFSAWGKGYPVSKSADQDYIYTLNGVWNDVREDGKGPMDRVQLVHGFLCEWPVQN